MPTFTLAQIEQRIWDSLDQNVYEFPEPNVRMVINQILCRINIILGLQTAVVPVPTFTVQNQFQYQVPSPIMIPITAYFEGQEIQRVSLDRLARQYPYWCTDNSSNLGPPARFASIDLQTFILHPADSAGGSLLEIAGIIPAVLLVNQSDVVTLEDVWVELLVAYGKMRLLFKEGGRAFQDAVAAYKPFEKKLRAASIWKSVNWPTEMYARQQIPAGRNWPH